MSFSRRISNTQKAAAQRAVVKLANGSVGIKSIVLSSADGFEIAKYPPDSLQASKLAAMGSSLNALATALTRESGMNSVRNVLIETAEGNAVLCNVSCAQSNATLSLFADNNAVIGHLLWITKRACQDIVDILDAP
jgi:uncharacterized protein